MNNRIGFLAYSLFSLENFYLQLQDHHDCWWAVTQEDTLSELISKGYKKIIYIPDSKKYFPDRLGNKFISTSPGEVEKKLMEFLNPNMWISDQGNRLTYGNKQCLWVQVFHSLCYKKHTFYPDIVNYDLVLLPSAYYKNKFINKFNLLEDSEKFKIVGWSKNDNLISGKIDKEKYLTDLGLDARKKVVLYAPTWGGFGVDMKSWGNNLFARWYGSDLDVLERLCRFIKELDVNLIIKTHHLSVWCNNPEAKKMCAKYGAVWLTDQMSNYQEDPNDLLKATDVLISDMSGILTEFLVLNRPIIYIEPDEGINAWEDSSLPPEFRAGFIVREVEELFLAIKYSLEQPLQFERQRIELKNTLFEYLDSNSTARGVKEINFVLENTKND